MPEIVSFCHIYGIYILVSIFSFINGASRILHLNLVLMVLSFLCCKILCIYLCLSISVSKICHIVINIFASRLVLFLTCSSFFDNLSLTVLTKCVFTKKEFNLKGRWCLFHDMLCDKSFKFSIYICPETNARSVTNKSTLQLVKYCVAHYRINWVSKGIRILCILITWHGPITVNYIKISFLVKSFIQTLRHTVNF